MTETTLADTMFAAYFKYGNLLEQMEDLLLVSINVDPNDPTTWPLDDFVFDWHDKSFEFKNVKNDWQPDEHMVLRWWTYGFYKAYICYENGTERIYHAPKRTTI